MRRSSVLDVLPPDVRKQFTSRDEADTKRANTTAQQWIFSLLQPAPTQTVGVIVLWPTQPTIGVTSFGTSSTGNAQAAQDSTTQQPIFVLVKGTKTAESADGG